MLARISRVNIGFSVCMNSMSSLTLTQLEVQWLKYGRISYMTGSKASDVQVSLNSDFKSATSSRHTIHYHIMIVSSVGHLEQTLEEMKSQFWSSLKSSKNMILQKGQQYLVLPFITGNLDSIPEAMGGAVSDKSTEKSRITAIHRIWHEIIVHQAVRSPKKNKTDL